MGYPYGPQQGHDPYAGQGYAQPGYVDPYGAQPGYADPYGAQPYGAPAYGVPAYGAVPHPGYGQPRAGGGTAITAAVIALLLSLLGLAGIGIAAAILLGTESTSATDAAGREEVTVAIALGAVPALLLFLGSVLLFRRKTAGRVILILLSSASLIFTAISIVATVSTEGSDGLGFLLIGGIVTGSIPLLLLLLAAAPSTGRWIKAGRQPAYPYY
ncbi:hypothetical protein BOX37_00700 [Nocardia mangyaensis]|uniref:Uncharacterized protein n=1 Tax=Nocardia mangyaensis TaxID=2213200 RepID=A0A1J0VL56_9NOCA|nr:hypothetical protein [Nocardia mangyaensis]APE32735.1 hypothetical protein BOX37_00700 [Nocardia mangyaensis]